MSQKKEVIKKKIRHVVRSAILPLRTVYARLRLSFGTSPLSELWGHDRGLPIYRYYLEGFLRDFSSDIKGRCLEFQDSNYIQQFGDPSAIETVDVLHIDDSNPKATLVADLTKPNNIPGNYFDCIICTHVLHIVFEMKNIISQLHRILKPQGVLLVAVPHVSMYDPTCREFWRFTEEGLFSVLTEAFGHTNVLVRSYGNSLTSAGQIRGLASDEFSKAELNTHDKRFAVEICGRAVKKTEV